MNTFGNNSEAIFQKYNDKISEYSQYIEQLKKSHEEYEQLVERLKTMPDKLHHEIMVPLGKKAFFEGSVKNSNEVMVLIGENYFTKRSCKQTIDIMKRRQMDVNENVKRLRGEIKGLRQRMELTKDISKAVKSKDLGDIMDIKEEYDSDEERERERKRKEEVKQKPKKVVKDEETKKREKEETKKEFDDLLKQLKILEEKEERAMKSGKSLEEEDEEEEGEEEENPFEEEEDLHDEEEEEELYRKMNKFGMNDDDDDLVNEDMEEYEEVAEYYDENGNLVDITDPNYEFIQEESIEEVEEVHRKVEDEIDLDSLDIQDFYLDKNGHSIDPNDFDQIKSFYEEKRRNREKSLPINTSTNPIAIAETSSTTDNHNIQPTSPPLKSILKNSLENDPKEYIKKVTKQVHFENGIKMPEKPVKSRYKGSNPFSGEIVENDSNLMFPLEFEHPVPPQPQNHHHKKGHHHHHHHHNQLPQQQQNQQNQQNHQNQQNNATKPQSRFKASRQNK